MICPECKEETSSILRMCENCNSDLEAYKAKRNEQLKGSVDEDGNPIYKADGTPKFGQTKTAGVLMMVGAGIWFFAGLAVRNTIFIYSILLFFGGLIQTIRGK